MPKRLHLTVPARGHIKNYRLSVCTWMTALRHIKKAAPKRLYLDMPALRPIKIAVSKDFGIDMHVKQLLCLNACGWMCMPLGTFAVVSERGLLPCVALSDLLIVFVLIFPCLLGLSPFQSPAITGFKGSCGDATAAVTPCCVRTWQNLRWSSGGLGMVVAMNSGSVLPWFQHASMPSSSHINPFSM